MRLRRLVLLLALLTLVVLVGRVTVAQDEKVLVIGHSESTDSLDPARGYTQTTSIIHQAIYDGLVTFPKDSAAEILPDLAASWEISEDGLTYTFTLREGVKFSNGDPLTAADVAFSFNRMINIKGQPSSLASTVASVAADGDSKVMLTLNTVDPSILAKLIGPGFQVTNAKEVKANGGTDAADADTTDKGEEWLNGHSAGTGPYMLASWEKTVRTELVRNPNYGGEAPYYDRIVIVNMPEAATQKAALESGEISLALDLTADQVATFEGNADITVYRGSGALVFFLLMNADPQYGGPLADPKVQQAARLALDYDSYIKLFGGVTPASVLPVGFLGAYGPDKALKRDVEAAKKLMADAGYADGFEMTMTYWSTTFQGVNIDTTAQKVQADLAEIGISVKLNGGELGPGLDEYRSGKQPFGLWFWGPDFIDPQNYVEFMPNMKVGLRGGWSDTNSDATGQDIRDRALKEVEPDARVAVFHEMQDYLQQTGPFAPFMQPGVQTAYRADLQGYYYHPQWTLDISLLMSGSM